jgi:hypothetical protein
MGNYRNHSKGSPKEQYRDKSPADVSNQQERLNLIDTNASNFRENFKIEKGSEKSIEVKKMKRRKVSIQSHKHQSAVLKSEEIKDKKDTTRKRTSVNSSLLYIYILLYIKLSFF